MSSVELLSATTTSTRPWYESSAMCSSVRTIASLSFHAATRIVTGGHSPSGQSPLGGFKRELLVARDQEREDHEPDDEAGDVGEEDRNHPGHDGADRVLKLTSPRLRRPDAEPDPGEGQSGCDREADGWSKPRGRSLAPRKTTELSAWWTTRSKIAVGDGDLVIDRGLVRRLAPPRRAGGDQRIGAVVVQGGCGFKSGRGGAIRFRRRRASALRGASSERCIR